MPQFTDNGSWILGRRKTWNVKITIQDAKRLRDAGLDLFETEQSKDRLREGGDAYAILYILLEPQAIEMGVSPKQFARRFVRALEPAMEALYKAVIEFFPEPQEKTYSDEGADEEPNPWKQIYEAAGALHLDPSPHSYRELVDMHVGHQKDQWQHTAEIEYIIAETHRSGKGQPYTPDYFNPYASKKKRRGRSSGEPLTVETLLVLQRVLRNRNDQAR